MKRAQKCKKHSLIHSTHAVLDTIHKAVVFVLTSISGIRVVLKQVQWNVSYLNMSRLNPACP